MSTLVCNLSNNISSWGNCLIQNVFFGDPVLAGIFIVIIFCFLMFRMRFPAPLALVIGIGLFGFLISYIAEPVFSLVLVIGFAIVGAMFILGLVKIANR